MQGLRADVRTPGKTHSNVIEDPLELQRLILSLHGSGVETVAAVNELDDVASGAAYCQVVLRAQILQGLHQTPLYRNIQLYDIGMATGMKCRDRVSECVCVPSSGITCMYPVSAVFTAVSTRPSRPAIVWKKNSVGVRPE